MEYLVVYMGIGILAGICAGLLGVGGGAVTVPLLLWAFSVQSFNAEVSTHMALATSLAAMIVTSISSSLAHSAKGAVIWKAFLWLSVGVLIGSAAGVLTAIKISGAVLQVAFGIFLSYVAVQMFMGFSTGPKRSLPKPSGFVAAGGVIGCISMYFGIGGGSMTVPYLSYCGVPPARAVGTSAALGLPIALWGTLLYVINGQNNSLLPAESWGYVYWPATMGIVLTSAIFAKVGAHIAHRLQPDQLRKVFGGVLILISLNLILTNIG